MFRWFVCRDLESNPQPFNPLLKFYHMVIPYGCLDPFFVWNHFGLTLSLRASPNKTVTVCLIWEVCNFISFLCLRFLILTYSGIFNLYEDIAIAGEGQHILTYTRHLWSLNSKCSLNLRASRNTITRDIRLHGHSWR